MSRERAPIAWAERLGSIEISADRLAAWRRALGPAPAGRRDVVNVHRPLEEDGTRDLVAWATDSGAALLLVPPDLDWQGATLWARPTVLAANGAELEELAAALETRGIRRLRSWSGPLRRLRAVVVLDGRADAVESGSLWRRLGLVCFVAPAMLEIEPEIERV